MLVGQQKYINLIKVYNIEDKDILYHSGVSDKTVSKFKKGETVYASKAEVIMSAIDSIIKFRKSLQ